MDPITVETWLKAIETTFLSMNCPLEYQVHCGTYMLKGGAHFWWKGAQRIIAPQGETITWCQFKEAYLCKYYPITARMKMRATFLMLKQGDKSVEEYDQEFNRLARFSFAYVSTEELKVERFIAGLREDLKWHVAALASPLIMQKPFEWPASLTCPALTSYNQDQPSHPTPQFKERGQTGTTPKLVDCPAVALISGGFRTGPFVLIVGVLTWGSAEQGQMHASNVAKKGTLQQTALRGTINILTDLRHKIRGAGCSTSAGASCSPCNHSQTS